MRLLLAMVAVVTALASSPVAGQAREVLLVPVSASDAEALLVLAQVRDAAGAAPPAGLSLLSDHAARERFAERGSSEPALVSVGAVDRWTVLARRALQHLANAEYALARDAIREADAFTASAAVELSREPARARRVLDTCLYGVRMLVETAAPGAEARAAACRRLVPRVQPSRYEHPPEILELLARVEAGIAASASGTLRVESEPAGCAVRVHGVELGQTPLSLDALVPGEYRVQVECDEGLRGRVHRVQVGEATPTVRIDTRLERVVRSDGVLRLEYAGEAVTGAQRVRDAADVASIIDAAEVWIVSEESGEVLVDRVDVAAAEVIGSVRGRGALLRGALEEHLGGPTTQAVATAAPAPGESSAALGAVRGTTDRTIAHLLGTVSGALGVTAFVSAWVVYGARLDLGPQLEQSHPGDDDYGSMRDRWIDLRYAVWGLAAAGAALGTIALPLAMHEEDHTPWWSWLFGAAGLALATVGVVEIATSQLCPDTADHDEFCVNQAAPVDRGAIFVGMGAPLIAVPLVYSFRELTGGAATLAFEPGPDRAIVSVRGRL